MDSPAEMESMNQEIIPVEEELLLEDSVQIASPKPPPEVDMMSFLQLGDRVYMECKYGRIIGQIYYRSEELIRVRPDGVSNTLYDFPMEEVEEGEQFDESVQVRNAYIIEKRKKEAWVEQQHLRVKQEVDTYNKQGEPVQHYRILDVNVEEDRVTLQQDGEEEPLVVACGYIGIPLELPFVTMGFPTIPQPLEEEQDERMAAEAEVQDEQEQEQEQQPPSEFEVVGAVRLTLPTLYEEAESYEQRIPDELQRMDALNDFLKGVDPAMQKDKRVLRNLRIMVDTLYALQKSSMEYNADGSLKGVATSSASSIMDLMETSVMPLGRPVLRVTKKEYTVGAHEEDAHGEEIAFVDFEDELEHWQHDASSKEIQKWNTMRILLEKYGSPYRPLPLTEPTWSARADSEFFRTSAPVAVEDPAEYSLPGYVRSEDKEGTPIFYRVPFGMERALATTYRKSSTRRKEGWMQEERAGLDSYLLFPLSAAPAMGSTRTYRLAVDSGRSQLPPQTMRMILQQWGPPKENGHAQDIIHLEGMGNQLANISLDDYVAGLTLPSLGIGDALPYLQEYGMENMELNEPLHEVLQTKITAYQSHYISVLGALRTALSSAPAASPPPPFLVNPAFLNDIQSQPLLAQDLKEYSEHHLSLADSDIGKVAYLLKKHPHYFQVAAGKHSKETLLAFNDAAREEYAERVRIQHQLQSRPVVERPRKNPCKHVAYRVRAGRIRNDTERFEQLAKIFRLFQGERKENWFECNVCHEHLMCIHERLQLRAYLNPKEKEVIEKEIILTCSGGQFQGKYICRNCGQPMRDLDFDQHLEFDENGKPKSGQAVLRDADLELEEQIEETKSLPIEIPLKEKLQLTDKEEKCFDVIREIAERVGVFMDEDGYRTVLRDVVKWMESFPKTAAAYDAAAAKSTKKRPPYEHALARDLISACTVFLLLEIQTRIPAYVVRFQLMGCKSPGFDGYPLDIDATQQQGIQYLACAVSSITKAVEPWSLGFQRFEKDADRQGYIVEYMLRILKHVASRDIIQAKLGEKRRYLQHVMGQPTDGSVYRPQDVLPARFLPEPLQLTAEEAVNHRVEPDALKGAQAQTARAQLWIRHAHHQARATAQLIRGSPYVETTCCMTSLREPGAFWKQQDGFPELPLRSLVPRFPAPSLLTEFHPRESDTGVVQPNQDLYYRLFLKYCFQGERKGYPHQPGLTNVCLWCGFEFPVHPSLMNADTEGRQALQGVDTQTAEFTELLDIIHRVNAVPTLAPPPLTNMKQVMTQLSELQPPPVADWKHIMEETLSRMLTILYPNGVRERPTVDEHEVAMAMQELSEVSRPAKEMVVSRLKSKYAPLLEKIANLSWVDFFHVLQSYLMVPFQRILSKFNGDSLTVSIELEKELSAKHVHEYLVPMLRQEVKFIQANKTLIQGDTLEFARSKLQTYLNQLTAWYPLMHAIRPHLVPGKEYLLQYIQQVILYVPLARLFNAAEDEQGMHPQGLDALGDPSLPFLTTFTAAQLRKYEDESLSYDDAQIKYLIAVRNEKERVNVIREFDQLDTDEREVELMKKKYGMGKWAVGGTKKIYAYDAEYWEEERQKRIQAGILDFPGEGPEDQPSAEGFMDGEEESGYDHEQMAEDDA